MEWAPLLLDGYHLQLLTDEVTEVIERYRALSAAVAGDADERAVAPYVQLHRLITKRVQEMEDFFFDHEDDPLADHVEKQRLRLRKVLRDDGEPYRTIVDSRSHSPIPNIILPGRSSPIVVVKKKKPLPPSPGTRRSLPVTPTASPKSAEATMQPSSPEAIVEQAVIVKDDASGVAEAVVVPAAEPELVLDAAQAVEPAADTTQTVEASKTDASQATELPIDDQTNELPANSTQPSPDATQSVDAQETETHSDATQTVEFTTNTTQTEPVDNATQVTEPPAQTAESLTNEATQTPEPAVSITSSAEVTPDSTAKRKPGKKTEGSPSPIPKLKLDRIQRRSAGAAKKQPSARKAAPIHMQLPVRSKPLYVWEQRKMGQDMLNSARTVEFQIRLSQADFDELQRRRLVAGLPVAQVVSVPALSHRRSPSAGFDYSLLSVTSPSGMQDSEHLQKVPWHSELDIMSASPVSSDR